MIQSQTTEKKEHYRSPIFKKIGAMCSKEVPPLQMLEILAQNQKLIETITEESIEKENTQHFFGLVSNKASNWPSSKLSSQPMTERLSNDETTPHLTYSANTKNKETVSKTFSLLSPSDQADTSNLQTNRTVDAERVKQEFNQVVQNLR